MHYIVVVRVAYSSGYPYLKYRLLLYVQYLVEAKKVLSTSAAASNVLPRCYLQPVVPGMFKTKLHVVLGFVCIYISRPMGLNLLGYQSHLLQRCHLYCGPYYSTVIRISPGGSVGNLETF